MLPLETPTNFAIREFFCSGIFPENFPQFSSRTPEQTPETATAFSSYLKMTQKWLKHDFPDLKEGDLEKSAENTQFKKNETKTKEIHSNPIYTNPIKNFPNEPKCVN